MKRYLIERTVPGAGNMSSEDLQNLASTSNAIISILNRPYKWIKSFVTGDKIYCVHEAENEADIREHSKCGNLPIDAIEEIVGEISPDTSK